MISVAVQQAPIAVEAALAPLEALGGGALASFVGLVRGDDDVETLTLEHYPGMTEAELARIESEAHARWNLQACLIIHRYGRLKPGDNIVLVITASEHRAPAFRAAEFLMDYLKSHAPFWKSESGPTSADFGSRRSTWCTTTAPDLASDFASKRKAK